MQWGTSKSLSFDKNDMIAVIKNAVLIGAAAAVTFLAESLAKIDIGTGNVLVIPIVAVALNSLSRWLKDYTKDTK
jgi:hypothetical protein